MAEITPFTPPPGVSPQAPSGPPPQPVAPAAPTPQPAGDRVEIQEGGDANRKWRMERNPATGEVVHRFAARNNVEYTTFTNAQGQVRFEAKLPAGDILPTEVKLEGGYGPGQPAQIQASVPGIPGSQPIQGFVTPDRKLAVQFGANGPIAMLDTETLDYGLSSPAVATGYYPTGHPIATHQNLQEMVHADTSHTIIADKTASMQNTPQGPVLVQTFTQVEDRPGANPTAKRIESTVAQNGMAPPDGGMSGGQLAAAFLTGGLSLLMPQQTPGEKVIKLSATRVQDGIQTERAGYGSWAWDALMDPSRWMTKAGLGIRDDGHVQPLKVQGFRFFGPQVMSAISAAVSPQVAAALQAAPQPAPAPPGPPPVPVPQGPPPRV